MSLFEDVYGLASATFQFKGTFVGIIDGKRIVEMDFYCSNCGKKLFHNGAMMKKTTICPFCNANLVPSNKNFQRLFDLEIEDEEEEE